MEAVEHAIQVTTPDGSMGTWLSHPAGAGAWPAVIVYMDAIGVRPALRAHARRLASCGYSVALPNLYYRSGVDRALDHVEDAELIGRLYTSLNGEGVARDSGALLDHLASLPEARGSRVGCVGYCMGGSCALTAAGCFPDRIAAAASIHGTRLATDAPDSPHRLADRMKARLYIGVAEIDPQLEAGEMERLRSALEGAAVRFTMETYPGAWHGFALTDMNMPNVAHYDRAAAELHWRRITQLLGHLG
jgi:carboxymethylenebutenolidase